MVSVLVATKTGCRAFSEDVAERVELPGRLVWALVPEAGGSCLALVDGKIWRRSAAAEWALVAETEGFMGAVVSAGGRIFGGSMMEAAVIRISASSKAERLSGFDAVSGRSEWFPQGPPLHIRALTATADGTALLAAVHVGGIPRSVDGGESWAPTIPVDYDVHEVRAHPSRPVVAAAAAVGLCVSGDGGLTWRVIADGLKGLKAAESLAVAVLPDEVLFSVQEGGAFAKRSQVWRWRIGGETVEQVRDGLPEYLAGKVDTNHIAAGRGRAAILDGGGALWLSRQGSTGWERIAAGLPDAYGVAVL
jgi:hypothetical protein